MIGMRVQVRSGRAGCIIAHDPADSLLEFKLLFSDGQAPLYDWVSGEDIFTEGSVVRLPQSGTGGRVPMTHVVGTDQHVRSSHLSGSRANQCNGNCNDHDDEEGTLDDLPTDDGIGAQYGLNEIQGGIGTKLRSQKTTANNFSYVKTCIFLAKFLIVSNM